MSIRYPRKLTSYFARYTVHGALAASFAILTACDSDSSTSPKTTGFLAGTSSNHQIGLVINSVGRSLTLFQLGDPTVTQDIALGTSNNISPVGFAIRGRRIAIPLGDAASVAYADLDTTTVLRYFTFTDGNATGSAFVNDTTIIAVNLLRGYVGRFTIGQASASIADTVTVAAPQPTAVIMAGTRAMIVSTNEDANYQPLGNGVVTAVDPTNMHVIGSVSTGGTNPNGAALGPDGFLYVVNTGDYVNPGSLTIINPATLQAIATIPNMGVGPGDISIDANGIAYISSYSFGTLVWNTQTRQFVRDVNNPVCAPKIGGGCKGAASAVTDASGNLYQVFGGSLTEPAKVYVYHSGTFALTDSVATGSGPVSLAIRTF